VSTTLDLPANHPARPAATASFGSDPASVLRADAAYDPPAPPAVEGALAAQAPDGTRQNPYIGHGVIRDVGPRALVLEHQAIPGFMGAMTMSFPVAEDVDLGSLEAGDAVTFRIELPESGGYRVFRVDTTGAAPEEEGAHEHAGPDSQPRANTGPPR
jgi:Cu/Ag efflux protein CusF